MDFTYIEEPEGKKPPIKITGKKRKMEDDKDELRQKAKILCRDSNEFSEVNKMSAKQLRSFVDQKEFDQSAALRGSVFDGIHRMYAFVADKLSGGEGFVQEQVLSDQSLRESIEQEALPLFQYLNNKVRIALLTGNNVVQGKIKQKAESPVVQEIFEVKENEESAGSSETPNFLGENPVSDLGGTEEGGEEGEEDFGEIQRFD
jgi:hypothetical protein